MYPGYNYFSFSPWITIISVVLQVVFWVVVFKIIFSLIRGFSGHHHDHEETCCREGDLDSNLEIIKSRYAKGEITKKGYEEMKKELS